MDSQEKENAGVLSVGQWEVHPWLGRAEIRDWCQKNDVVIQVSHAIFQLLAISSDGDRTRHTARSSVQQDKMTHYCNR